MKLEDQIVNHIFQGIHMKTEQLEDLICHNCKVQECCSSLPHEPHCKAFDVLSQFIDVLDTNAALILKHLNLVIEELGK